MASNSYSAMRRGQQNAKTSYERHMLPHAVRRRRLAMEQGRPNLKAAPDLTDAVLAGAAERERSRLGVGANRAASFLGYKPSMLGGF